MMMRNSTELFSSTVECGKHRDFIDHPMFIGWSSSKRYLHRLWAKHVSLFVSAQDVWEISSSSLATDRAAAQLSMNGVIDRCWLSADIWMGSSRKTIVRLREKTSDFHWTKSLLVFVQLLTASRMESRLWIVGKCIDRRQFPENTAHRCTKIPLDLQIGRRGVQKLLKLFTDREISSLQLIDQLFYFLDILFVEERSMSRVKTENVEMTLHERLLRRRSIAGRERIQCCLRLCERCQDGNDGLRRDQCRRENLGPNEYSVGWRWSGRHCLLEQRWSGVRRGAFWGNEHVSAVRARSQRQTSRVENLRKSNDKESAKGRFSAAKFTWIRKSFTQWRSHQSCSSSTKIIDQQAKVRWRPPGHREELSEWNLFHSIWSSQTMTSKLVCGSMFLIFPVNDNQVWFPKKVDFRQTNCSKAL